jgi:HAD superfamily hydrolase (TIGR01458 family)
MNALLIDLDGVLYVGDEPVPGAARAVDWLSAHGVPYLFVTNTSSKPRHALLEKLAAMGVTAPMQRLLTPAVAARQWLARHAPGPAALFVPEGTAGEFGTLPRLAPGAEQGAASVVIGDLGEGWDFRTLNRAFRLLMAEPPPVLLALGMTRYWHAADGLRLDVAPFIRALEHAAGCEAVVLGKPSKAYFEAALGTLRCRPDEAVMVGDDIAGDVGGAQEAGLRGLLVRTGKFREGDLDGPVRPDAVLDSIAELPHWWRNEYGPR